MCSMLFTSQLLSNRKSVIIDFNGILNILTDKEGKHLFFSSVKRL